jgi:hypothetical protein
MKNIAKGALLAVIACAATTLFSCQKNKMPPTGYTHDLGFSSDKLIKIGQEAIVYDSSALNDSFHYLNPPTNRVYIWTISPDSHCASLSGKSKNGIADIIFSCPGTYKVSAKIYDSLSKNLLGHTDTVQITVTAETLHQFEPALAGDSLIATSATAFMNSDTSQQFIVFVNFSTAKTYDYSSPYTQIDYTGSRINNGLNLIFSDSVRLNSYPLAWGYGTTGKVVEFIALDGFVLGEPSRLNYTWLGVTHSISITVINIYGQVVLN